MRKLYLDPHAYHLTTSYNSKSEACVFYPNIPRAWFPDGLTIIPSLNEKNIKGSFEIDVFSSEKIYINQLPESFSKSLSADWVDGHNGGSHINSSTWKKNPKFTLKFRYPLDSDEPTKVRIALSRFGSDWHSRCKRDPIGCMIGFYLFIDQGGDHSLYYESPFLPDQEVSTETSFTLPQLGPGENYSIMPATYKEGKHGAFVLSILSECEFSFIKEKN